METKKQTYSKREPSLLNIADKLNQLNQKLDTLMNSTTQILNTTKTLLQKRSISSPIRRGELNLDPDAMSLLSLPMSLRKTVMVLYRLERATADELAQETGRLRAVESSCANQLVRMKYLKKSREGRDVVFYIDLPEEANL